MTATDSDGNSATLPVTVTVTNVDEMPVVSSSGANCEENAGKTGYDCDYAENGKGPVATFTAVDPEGAAVSWDLDTPQAGPTMSALQHLEGRGAHLQFLPRL